MENNFKSTSKSLTSETFSLKLGAHLEKKSGSWTVSQTTEWKMSFVALVSAGRSRADTALQE